MSADRFEELYERFADGTLAGADRDEFQRLLEDPANRARFAALSTFEAVVGEELKLAGTERTPVEAKKASSKSWPRVGSRRVPMADPVDESRLLGRIGLAAAAAALFILVLVFVTSTKSDDAPVVVRPKLEVAPPPAPPPPESPKPKVDVAPTPKPAAPEERLTPRKFDPVHKPEAKPPAPPPSKPAKPVEKSSVTRVEEPVKESATFIATVERIAGEVLLGTEPAVAGKGIASGLGVATGKNGYAAIAYPDGSRVELGATTTLARLTDGATGKSASLEQGMIFVDAVKQPAGRPLSISTAQAESLVVGTQFVLSAQPGMTRIDVREGRVKFTRLPQGVSSVMVNAGHYAIAGGAGDTTAKPGIGLWKAPPAALQLWLRADAGVKLNGDKVATWSDLSPAGNVAAQDKPGAQPTFVANAWGSRPALRFDGADDSFLLPDGFSDFRAGLTAFVVARPAAGRAYCRFIDLDVGPACDNIVFGQKDAADKLGFWVYSNSQTKGKVEAAGAVTVGEVQCFCALLAPGGRVTLYRNGAAVATGDTSVPRSIVRKPNQIAKSNTGGDPLFKGDLFEILLYNRALSDAERVYIESYLNAKYFDPTTPPATLRPPEK